MDPSAVPSSPSPLGMAEIFTFLFLMVGPLKLIGPFARVTREMSGPERNRFAFQAFAISTIAVVAGGFVGAKLIAKWNVTMPALTLAGGLVFLLVALRMVLHQYEAAPPPPSEPSAKPTSLQFSFPNVVTPYGIAAVIIFMMIGGERLVPILGLILTVMGLNLLAMLFARPILGTLGLPLQVLGAVLGIAQVALAVQIILNALRAAGIIPTPAG